MLRRQRHLPIARRPDAAPADHRPAARGGFTLVEMMVAIVILAIGLIGMASTAGYVVRQVSGGSQQTIAASVVQSRTEWLRSMPCSAIKDSTAVTRGVRERWVPGATQNKVLFVTDTVWYSVSGTKKKATYTMTVPCW